jgi:poly-gamma-glutamate capsule biosynthesis protein CapA/YwtB (metallophosphatase superfamily)
MPTLAPPSTPQTTCPSGAAPDVHGGPHVPTSIATRGRHLAGLALAIATMLVVAGCGQDQPEAGLPATPDLGADQAGSAPGQAKQDPPAEEEPEPVTLAFGGDVHFEGVITGRLSRAPRTALGPVASVLKRADLAVVNLETAVTERGTPPAGKEFTFRAPATAFTALKAAGVDVASMANNHGMDYGLVGLRDSLAAAKAARFPVIGAGDDADEAFKAKVFEVKGQRIAVIGATQVLDASLAAAWSAGDGKPGLASAYQTERLAAAVKAAREDADTVVVFLHWGQERNTCPIDRQKQLARRLEAAGADVIVGSHAHVLLGGGMLGDAYVHYGLGNFVFYSRPGTPGTQSGVLLLTVDGRKVTKARWQPATIQGGVPVPLQGAAADRARSTWESRRGCTGLDAFEAE